jgi:hypothetical protein
MLGDYQGVAEPTNGNVPAVPIWIDTRTGDPDPFIARVGISPQLSFGGWQAARLSFAQINNPALGGQNADADRDSKKNLLEYALGTPPLTSDTGGPSLTKNGSILSITYPRLGAATDVTLHAFRSLDLSPNSWTRNGVTEMMLSDDGIVQMWQASTTGTSQMFLRLQATQP